MLLAASENEFLQKSTLCKSWQLYEISG